MGQEYFINSQELQSKVDSLLPSQGGAGAGFDLSASTQIVPIIDLTESAQGSNFRQDLQTAFSFDSASVFNFANASTDIIVNTGYYRIFAIARATGVCDLTLQVSNGVATKNLFRLSGITGSDIAEEIDINVFNPAGYTVTLISDSTNGRWIGNSRQIADINGELVNP